MAKEIRVAGTIVSDDEKWMYDYFGIECTSPSTVRDAIAEADGEDITIIINSGGGDLFAGLEMNYEIAKYEGNTTVDIAGLAASAATIIACAGKKVRASAGAQYMIHNVSSSTSGDYKEMEHMSEVLQSANISISNVYQQKTGLDEKTLLKLMNNETWMDSKKAKEYGFIDEIIGENDAPSSFSIYNGVATILSDETKAKLRAQLEQSEQADDHAKEYAYLELLKLKGGQKNA